MKTYLAAAALAGLLACSNAGAQVRAGAAAGAPPVAAARPAQPAARAARPRAVAPKAGSTQPSGATQTARSRRAGAVVPPSPGLFPNAPSLNDFFGAPVSAATGGPFANGLQSRFGHRGHPGPAQNGFVPFIFGYPYYYDDLNGQPADQAAAQQAPQSDEQLSAEQQTEVQGTQTDSRSSDSVNTLPPEPVRDIGNFILVRRDGSTLLASAFSVVGPQLRYITPDGARRTLPMSDLDVNATQEMNEARGTTLQFQN